MFPKALQYDDLVFSTCGVQSALIIHEVSE